MNVIQRISKFMEGALATSKPKTADDFTVLANTLRETDLPQAQAALDEIETAYDSSYFDLAGDEVALRRAIRKRDEARANVAQIREAIRRAESQAERLATQAYRDAQLQQAAQTEAILAQRVAVAKRLDTHIAALAKDFVELQKLNAAVFEKAPHRLRHWPAMFSAKTIQQITEGRLWGFTDGAWKGFAGIETPYTARKLRTLETRASEERALVMSEQPQPDPEPPLAA
jgi:hypothetical protein